MFFKQSIEFIEILYIYFSLNIQDIPPPPFPLKMFFFLKKYKLPCSSSVSVNTSFEKKNYWFLSSFESYMTPSGTMKAREDTFRSVPTQGPPIPAFEVSGVYNRDLPSTYGARGNQSDSL